MWARGDRIILRHAEFRRRFSTLLIYLEYLIQSRWHEVCVFEALGSVPTA